MCGIGGVVNKNGKKIDKNLMQQMLSVIHHRGPDAEGILIKDNFALGHKRLAIIDLSDAGKQPMSYRERYVIVYNGEIYNYLELKNELLKMGYSFYTETDTEVIIAAYDCWGEGCLNKFNGMWAFAIYDEIKKILFCARDRFGIKPFYYLANEETFIFASEIKQILEINPDEAKMNENRVWDFLCRGIMEEGEETFFKDIKQLSAGMCGNFFLETNKWNVRKWYDLEKHKKAGNYKKEVQKFKEIFLDSIRLRLRADVSVGACLSGGLDSSSIVCGISKTSDYTSEIHTISSCFDNEQEKEYDEQEYIDEVVKQTQAISHKIYIDCESMFEKLDEIIWHMDEPFTTTSICAQWAVFEEAQKNHLIVMLDGQGADEQLSGYTSFYLPTYIDLIKRGKLIELFHIMKSFDEGRGKIEGISAKSILKSAINTLFCDKRWYKCIIQSRLLANKNKKIVNAGKTVPYPYPMDKGNVRDLYNARNFDGFTKDMVQINLPSLLHFEDRNSMAHSVETRVPFLDYRLVETIYDMPAEYKIRKGYTKAVMRDAMEGILPKKIQMRVSKLGFATPEDVWMRNNQERFREELIQACQSLAGFLEEKRVLNWFDYCVENNTRDFLSFRIICLGRWVKIFKVERKG